MIATILQFLNPLKAVGKQILDYQEIKLNSLSEIERVHADVKIEQLQSREAILIGEQKHRFTRLIRPLFAIPFVIYNFKVLVIDKVFKLGTTDTISPEFWQLQMIIFGAYFLTRPFEKKS